MTTAARPNWVRLDTDMFRNPKFHGLIVTGQYRAIYTWIDCLFYAAEHLTDGYIPDGIPQRLGHRIKEMNALCHAELIHRMDLTAHTGWLIHDYLSYQPSKDYWINLAENRRKAARARWNGDANA